MPLKIFTCRNNNGGQRYEEINIVPVIFGRKCTLAASRAALGEYAPMGQTDRRTLDRYVALSTIDAASVINKNKVSP